MVAGRHGFADRLKTAKRPLIIVGQGALSRPDGAAVLALAAQAAPDLRRRDRGAGTASASSTPLPPASARSISASCRGRAGSTPPRWPRRRARRRLQPRRRRDRHRAGRLRGLPGHPRRPRRASRRRDPAGRRLHREVRHLRQHRRPRADGQPRRLPAGRRARGLGDPAGALGRARAPAAVRLACRSCGRSSMPSTRTSAAIDAIASDDGAAARAGTRGFARRAVARAVRSARSSIST